ncbi:MAG: hypothetical protein RJB66_1790 [Pseudomonadota bacterium]|jgi:S-formylglutathione hydrolase FrmB
MRKISPIKGRAVLQEKLILSKLFTLVTFLRVMVFVLLAEPLWGVSYSKKIYSTEPSPHLKNTSVLGIEENRSIPYQVFLPNDFPHCPSPEPCYSVVYFLHGRGSDSSMLDELGVLPALDHLTQKNNQLKMIIVAPEGELSYWTDHPSVKNGRADWAHFVAETLVNSVEKQFPAVIKDPEHRLLAGISMGGHGALQVALNFRDQFSCIAAHSPVLRSFAETRELREQFGEFEEYQKRDPLSLLYERRRLQNLEPFFKGLWLDIGAEDWALVRTSQFVDLLLSTYNPKTMTLHRSLPGHHDRDYWQDRLPEYLQWYSDCLSKKVR